MRILLLLVCTFVISLSTIAHALEVTPDTPLIINLREDAKTVILGNPNHASVSLETPRMLLITAGMPGMTGLTVLGQGGNVILNEKVIVNGASEGYVRVQNACINAEDECQPVRMFYCEDGSACHNVIVAEEPPVETFGGAPVAAPIGDEEFFVDEGI